MRICSPQLGLSPEATLGGEVYDREILTRLAGSGVGVDVILPSGLASPDVANLRITRLPLRRGLRWYVSNPLFVPYVGRAFRDRPFDLLRVHSLRFTGPAALAARRVYHLPVPVVAHHHHVDHDRLTGAVDGWVVARCDMIITVSEFSRRQLVGTLGAPPERVHVVHNGVGPRMLPAGRDDELSARWGVSGRPVLLYVGSLIPRKNVPVLLQAMQQILRARPDVCLLVAGKGPSEQMLRQHASELGLEAKVQFVGFVPETEKVKYYNLADVFVLPSRLEGFGLAAAEAMACGKPVIGGRAGALPEVVADGATGILCDPGDPGAFARAALRLLDDASLAESMGRAGQERVRSLFSWDLAAGRIAALYAEAVRGWQIR